MGLQHVTEAFLDICNSHSSQNVGNLPNLGKRNLHCLILFLVLSNPLHFFCLVSAAECFITPQLMCYFALRYYGPKYVEPWYLSTSSTVLCDLCNKALYLLHVWHGWHGFCYRSNLIPKTEINTHRAHKD